MIVLSNLGIAAATVYFVGHGDYAPIHAFRNNFAISVWLSAASIGLGIVFVCLTSNWLFQNVDRRYLLLSLISVPIILLVAALNAIHQGIQDFKRFNLIGMISQFLLLVFVFIGVWWLRGRIIGAMAAYIGANLVTLVILVRLLWQKLGSNVKLSVRPEKDYIQKLFSYGAITHVGNIITFLNYRLDNVILNYLAGPAQVGIYSISVGLGERFWIPSSAIGAVLLPRIASLEGNEAHRTTLTPLMSRVVFWLSLVLAVVAWPIVEWVIRLLYSNEFQEAALPLRMILPGIVFLNMARILANDIAGRGKPLINLYLSTTALVINIIANVIFIPVWGATGAALSSTISYSILALLTINSYSHITHIPWHELILIQKTDFHLIALAIERIRRI